MKPQDFFIGTLDFFAIIVPGAMLLILAATISPDLDLWIYLQNSAARDSQTLILLICIVSTYAVGTVISRLASLLDNAGDGLTGALIRRAEATQGKMRFGLDKIDKLRQGEALAHDLELEIVPGIEQFETGRRPWSTRAFWRNYLRLNCAVAMTELDQIEAQQKQFRSLSVGALVLAAAHLFYGEPWVRLLNALGYVAAALVLAYGYWGLRTRFMRRLFELSIAFAISQQHFQAKSESFINDRARWRRLVTVTIGPATDGETGPQG